MTTKPHLFVFPPRRIVVNEIAAGLWKCLKYLGSREALYKALKPRWKQATVDKYLAMSPLPDWEGVIVIDLQVDDVMGATEKRLELLIYQALMCAMHSYFGPDACQRTVATFWGEEQRNVLRALNKAPAARGSLPDRPDLPRQP